MEDMRLLTTDQQNSEKEIKGENHEKFEMQEKKKEEKKREETGTQMETRRWDLDSVRNEEIWKVKKAKGKTENANQNQNKEDNKNEGNKERNEKKEPKPKEVRDRPPPPYMEEEEDLYGLCVAGGWVLLYLSIAVFILPGIFIVVSCLGFNAICLPAFFPVFCLTVGIVGAAVGFSYTGTGLKLRALLKRSLRNSGNSESTEQLRPGAVGVAAEGGGGQTEEHSHTILQTPGSQRPNPPVPSFHEMGSGDSQPPTKTPKKNNNNNKTPKKNDNNNKTPKKNNNNNKTPKKNPVELQAKKAKTSAIEEIEEIEEIEWVQSGSNVKRRVTEWSEKLGESSGKIIKGLPPFPGASKRQTHVALPAGDDEHQVEKMAGSVVKKETVIAGSKRLPNPLMNELAHNFESSSPPKSLGKTSPIWIPGTDKTRGDVTDDIRDDFRDDIRDDIADDTTDDITEPVAVEAEAHVLPSPSKSFDDALHRFRGSEAGPEENRLQSKSFQETCEESWHDLY